MLNDKVVELYGKLAELDAGFRKDVERETSWIADVTSHCIDRYREHINDAFSAFTSAKQNSLGISLTASVASTLQREVDTLTTTFKKQCAPGGLSLLEAWEKSKCQVQNENGGSVVTVSQLLSHRITHELPSMVDSGQDTLFAIRAALEEERSVSVEFEVMRRTRSRHRAHRLTTLEAEQKELKASLEHATQELRDAEQRAKTLLSRLQERSGAVFERYSKWDLLRRRLASVCDGQESCKSAIHLLTDHIVEGSHVGSVAQIGSTFSLPQSCSVTGVPGHGRMVGTGSVEWLHRLTEHWNTVLRECGRSDMVIGRQVQDEAPMVEATPVVDNPLPQARPLDVKDATTNTWDPTKIDGAMSRQARAPPPTPTQRILPTSDDDVTKDMMRELLSRHCGHNDKRFDPLSFQLSSPRH